MIFLKYKLEAHSCYDVIGIAPYEATPHSAGIDLSLPYEVAFEHKEICSIDLLISFDLAINQYLLMYPRSSLLIKHGLMSPTSVIDSDYKKSVHFIAYNVSNKKVTLPKGARVVQIIPMYKEVINYQEVKDINDTGRGGLGSTGI